MDKVFVLTHTNELPSGEEDIKFIGVYSAKENAEKALSRTSLLPGFCDNPTGFYISCYEINKDHWTEGFFTYVPSEEYGKYLLEKNNHTEE